MATVVMVPVVMVDLVAAAKVMAVSRAVVVVVL
jgi:hypothetical protein